MRLWWGSSKVEGTVPHCDPHSLRSPEPQGYEYGGGDWIRSVALVGKGSHWGLVVVGARLLLCNTKTPFPLNHVLNYITGVEWVTSFLSVSTTSNTGPGEWSALRIIKK